MKCPFCGCEETQVKDSRNTDDNSAVRRRRECPECGSRFTTFERVQLRELIVVKRNGERTLFDRDKLEKSITLAVRKRPISAERVEKIVNSLQRKFESSGETEITTKQIGESVMEALSHLDNIAYIRFASVYKDFRSIKDLEDYIMTLQKKLENKEESINKLDYKNKQLIKEIHNKTAGAKTFKNPLTRAVSGNVKNTSTDIAIKNDNIFAELNKGKNNIENDEEKNVNLISQKKVDEFLTTNAGEEEDFDEVKQITKQMNFLKKELKELKSFNQQITEQVKELIKNIKCDNKNKLQIAQICQLLNLSPNTTNRILTNNKKGIKI